jgi:hypothetical protein
MLPCSPFSLSLLHKNVGVLPYGILICYVYQSCAFIVLFISCFFIRGQVQEAFIVLSFFSFIHSLHFISFSFGIYVKLISLMGVLIPISLTLSRIGQTFMSFCFLTHDSCLSFFVPLHHLLLNLPNLFLMPHL